MPGTVCFLETSKRGGGFHFPENIGWGQQSFEFKFKGGDDDDDVQLSQLKMTRSIGDNDELQLQEIIFVFNKRSNKLV